jgi:hypothetical protein
MSVATLARKPQGHGDGLRPDENPFSTNKVTGHSLNFPIIGTCTPTVVCADTCYFASGPSTWSASLAKQHRLLNSLRADPVALAATIAYHAVRLRLTFIRWCGGGDLVEETPACLDAVARLLPTVPQWVVTRKPTIAATIRPRPNVYVHFSVDRSSWSRLDEFRSVVPGGLQWFWSYQCDKGEVPLAAIAPVVFRDKYDLDGSAPIPQDCPLNLNDSIVRVCESCRRCFNGTALEMATECHAKPASSPRLFGLQNNPGGGS